MKRTHTKGDNGKSFGVGKQTSDRIRSSVLGHLQGACTEGGVCRVGVDLVPVVRMRDLLDRHGRALTRRFFHSHERAVSQRARNPVEVLARCWGLREAAFKVVGGGRLWNDYCVDLEQDPPGIVVSDALFQRSNVDLRPPSSWLTEVERTGHGVIAVAAATWATTPTETVVDIPSLDGESSLEPPEHRP